MVRHWLKFAGLTGAILVLCVLLPRLSRGEDGPQVQAGIALNAPLTPEITTIPVTVSGFYDIGSFTLSLNYDSTVVQYTGYTANAAFSGMTVGVSAPGGIFKRLTITWPASGTGITLPDQAALLNLSFKYKTSGSRSLLTWYNSGSTCEFTRYASGAYTILNDTPTESFYTSGVITNHAAPVTTAPIINGATPGQVSVPVTVRNFTNIGSITLTLQYDPAVLTYLSFTQNPAVPGSFSVGSNYNPETGITTINMGFYVLGGFSLPDNSTLLTLLFNYSNTGGGNFSDLILQTTPNAACEYSDGQYRLLYDAKPSVFYSSGWVASQLSPQTWLSSNQEAVPSESLPVTVKVSDFNNISSFTLSFKYDPSVLTYNSASTNAAFGDNLSVVNQPAGSDGKRTIVMSWNGASPLTLAAQSVLATLDFTYLSGTTALAWVTSDNTSCRFSDALGNTYYNKPKSYYFRDGVAASHTAPRTAAWYASPATGQPVTIPVLVFDYTNIGLFSLTLDYDPGVLTYQGTSLVPSLGGTFSATSPGPGRISINWNGTAASLPDSSILLNLSFNYQSGETALAFYDNGSSCRYAESLAGAALYDIPKASYYINGYVGANPLLVDFTAGNTLPEVNTTVNFTDLSTGGATSRQWIFSPPNVDFMNGTTATSQNPQVRFPANGVYTVMLIEYRDQAGGIKVKSEYIHAGTPGLWTGLTSTAWYTVSNWHNYMVPTAATGVVIPATAAHWPVFTGEFTVGTQCQSLLLQGGGNCTMTVRPGP